MRKIISVILLLAMSFQILCPAFAAEETEVYYTTEEIEQIILNYQDKAHMLSALFEKPDGLGYWKLINDMESSGFTSGAINVASKLIDEEITEERCIEILANAMAMQTGDLAEQIEKQSQFDNLKSGKDYALDVLDIATGCIGVGEILKTASPIIDAASGGTEVLIENAEQAKYYQMAIQDYSRMYKFLDAVSQYAENETLRKVAKDLQKTNDTFLEERLKYLNNTLESQIDYTAKFFYENMSFEILKQSDLYLNDETTKFFVDSGSKLVSELFKLDDLGKMTFRIMILSGDYHFGTSNTFNRYQEMKLTADIASALVKANEELNVSTEKKTQETVLSIQEKCDYYRMLLATHARGEYLLFQLVTNDAGYLSVIYNFFDMFKEPDETAESWYEKQTGIITEYNAVLDKIMDTGISNWLTEELIAQYGGFYPVGERTADISLRDSEVSNYSIFDFIGWDDREGIVSAAVTDLDNNNESELLVLYVKQYSDEIKREHYEFSSGSSVYVDIYEKEKGVSVLKSSCEIENYSTMDYTLCHIGLITLQDKEYLFVETDVEWPWASAGILARYKAFGYQDGKLYRYLHWHQEEAGTHPIQIELDVQEKSDSVIKEVEIYGSTIDGRPVGKYAHLDYGEAFTKTFKDFGFPEPKKLLMETEIIFAEDYYEGTVMRSFIDNMTLLTKVKSYVNSDEKNNNYKLTSVIEDYTGVNIANKKINNVVFTEPSPQILLSEDEARKIALAYWDMPEGRQRENDSENPGSPSLLSVPDYSNIVETKTRVYYKFWLKWLVDEGTQDEHWSTVDWVYVDAETGETSFDLPNN